MTSFKLRTNTVLFCAFLLFSCCSTAFADKKSDLYAKGVKSMNAGGSQDILDARDAFCQVQKEDAEYSDGTNGTSQKLCTDMTAAANRILNLNKVRFGEGNDLLAAGKYDEAEAKFKSVKFGEYVNAAKSKLADIAKLRQDKQNTDAQNNQEKTLNARFDQGKSAWENGNFDLAKSTLGGLTGSHADEAKDILSRISRYESFMQQAQNFANSKNYNAAATFYNQAGAISPNGPGNPFAKAQEMANQATSSTVASNNPPPNPVVPSTNKNTVANNQIEKVDENASIESAKQLIAKKKYPQARKLLDKVLAQNFRNPAALDLMKSLPQPAAQPLTTASASDEDPVLAAAIVTFYGADYDGAEARLRSYLYSGTPKKPGLANFYLGATLLSRFYVSGESDQSLRLNATRFFSDAKAVIGFKVPEKLISPKILAAFNGAKSSAAATSTP